MREAAGFFAAVCAGALLLVGCRTGSAAGPPPAPQPAPAKPQTTASSSFWEHWGDGRAEIDAYAIKTSRYGAIRKGTVVLVYVTEPMDSRTWIKDDRDDVPPEYRVNVMKLNLVLKFRTGIYPYSVMTSVFAPVDGYFAERFSPVKITLSAQEWCGHVYHALKPSADGFRSEIRSYFSSEGEQEESIAVPPGTLYEDALYVQLRELDGPLFGGKDWKGQIVPRLWTARRTHTPLRPVQASVRRTEAEREGTPVTRFLVEFAGASATIDVERDPPRRILGWSTSDGDEASLLGSARLPYWKLNRPGDESHLERLGLTGGGS